MTAPFHFSVDLEDVRDHVRDGLRYSERVPRNTERYMEFLRDHDVRATFFVVGLVADRYPGLIRDIVAEGHEVACHTHRHVQLDKQTPVGFRDDLQQNLEALARCGATDVVGFRAPTFSLIESTQWAYAELERLGFRYSSSVLPARNLLYGWPAFGSAPRMVGSILEMPLTLHPGRLRLPIAGGVHFRVLPFAFIEHGIKALLATGQSIQTYFHPYDIDSGQEYFMHPDLSDNRFLNALMYVGRSRVLPRLEELLEVCRFTDYRSFVDEWGRP